MAYTNTDWSNTTLPEKMRRALDGMEEGIEERLRKDGSESMTGDLDMGGDPDGTGTTVPHKITNVATPDAQSDALDAANKQYVDDREQAVKQYVDDQDLLKVNKSGDVMSGDLDMAGTHNVKGLQPLTEESASDYAADKGYVDKKDSDLWKAANDTFLPLAGGTVTGPIIIEHTVDPAPEHAARNRDVADAIASAAEGYVLRDGTQSMTGNLNMGGSKDGSETVVRHRITNVATPSDPGDAVNLEYITPMKEGIDRLGVRVSSLSEAVANSGSLGDSIFVTDPTGSYAAGDIIPSDELIPNVLRNMLCRQSDPAIVAQPSCSIDLSSDINGDHEAEVGKEDVLRWKVRFDPGAYSYKSLQTYVDSGESINTVVQGTGVDIYGLEVMINGQSIVSFQHTVKSTDELYTFINPNVTENVEPGDRIIHQGDIVYCMDSSVLRILVEEDPSDPVSWEPYGSAPAFGGESNGPAIKHGFDGLLPLQNIPDGGITASARFVHTDGNEALTNIETLPQTSVKILGGSENVKSAADEFKGYRKMFYGAVVEQVADGSVVREAITSSVIRGLSGNKANKSEHKFVAPAGSTKVIIAFPSTFTSNKPTVKMYTLSWEDYSEFFKEVSGGIQVADARGGNNGLMNYTVYVYEFNKISADTQFSVTLR